mgnify:CR=1 FL=1
MLIYMVRHGQTDWNAEGRFQGQQDIPLNAVGRQQATGNGLALRQVLGTSVADFHFVSSPLGRARETMERLRSAIGLDPAAYVTDDRLREICFGDWEGHTVPELYALYPDRVEARSQGKWDFIPPGDGAESYEILSWRVGAWLASLERPTVCVSHGGVIRGILRLLGGYDPEEACGLHVPQDRILKLDRDNGRADWL